VKERANEKQRKATGWASRSPDRTNHATAWDRATARSVRERVSEREYLIKLIDKMSAFAVHFVIVLLHDGILQGRILHYVHGAQTVFSSGAFFAAWVNERTAPKAE